jgi:hypothetical protein
MDEGKKRGGFEFGLVVWFVVIVDWGKYVATNIEGRHI